jgi:hypothetical protein
MQLHLIDCLRLLALPILGVVVVVVVVFHVTARTSLRPLITLFANADFFPSRLFFSQTVQSVLSSAAPLCLVHRTELRPSFPHCTAQHVSMHAASIALLPQRHQFHFSSFPPLAIFTSLLQPRCRRSSHSSNLIPCLPRFACSIASFCLFFSFSQLSIERTSRWCINLYSTR